MTLLNWKQALAECKTGKSVGRESWVSIPENQPLFIFNRPADTLEARTLMQFRSIPEATKTTLRKLGLADEGACGFTEYLCCVRVKLLSRPDLNLCFENVWEPTPEDLSANDWFVL